MDFQINRNYSLDTDSFEYPKKYIKHIQAGGQIKDKPTGGFPPILLCETKKKEEVDEDGSKREYKTHKSAVSIKTILEKRRSNKPFVVESK